MKFASKPVFWAWMLALASIISVVAHNFLGYLWEGVGVIFFFLTFIAFFALIGLSIYIVYKYIRNKQPKDAWKLGFIGVVLLGFMLLVGFNNYWAYIVPGYFLLFFLFYFWK